MIQKPLYIFIILLSNFNVVLTDIKILEINLEIPGSDIMEKADNDMDNFHLKMEGLSKCLEEEKKKERPYGTADRCKKHLSEIENVLESFDFSQYEKEKYYEENAKENTKEYGEKEKDLVTKLKDKIIKEIMNDINEWFSGCQKKLREECPYRRENRKVIDHKFNVIKAQKKNFDGIVKGTATLGIEIIKIAKYNTKELKTIRKEKKITCEIYDLPEELPSDGTPLVSFNKKWKSSLKNDDFHVYSVLIELTGYPFRTRNFEVPKEKEKDFDKLYENPEKYDSCEIFYDHEGKKAIQIYQQSIWSRLFIV